MFFSFEDLGNKSGAPSFYGMLAELEAMTGELWTHGAYADGNSGRD